MEKWGKASLPHLVKLNPNLAYKTPLSPPPFFLKLQIISDFPFFCPHYKFQVPIWSLFPMARSNIQLNKAFNGLFGLVFCMIFLMNKACAREFQVGGPKGWSVPPNNTLSYNQWAERNRFHIGDSLRKFFFHCFLILLSLLTTTQVLINLFNTIFIVLNFDIVEICNTCIKNCNY